MSKNRNLLFGAAMVIGASLQPLAAQAVTCADDEVLVPVKGKIFSNGLQPGTTLGVVHLRLGKERMKCGILGQGAAGSDGSLNYIDTLVCDDQVVFPLTGETVHSQLTLNTSGFANALPCPAGYPPGSIFGTFHELSVPISGTGRGVFTGVETGEFHIEGTINCLAAIDMKFTGAVCLKSQ